MVVKSFFYKEDDDNYEISVKKHRDGSDGRANTMASMDDRTLPVL